MFVITQILVFLVGLTLLVIDGSNGYIDQMTWVSYVGISFCILGIGLEFVIILIYKIFRKIKGKNKKS